MTPADLANLKRLEAEYREWEREHGYSSAYSDERHRLSCTYLDHGAELIGAAEERDALRAELDAIHATFGGAPSWASVAKNLIDARAQRDAAEEENDRLRAREAEWVAAMPQCHCGCGTAATRRYAVVGSAWIYGCDANFNHPSSEDTPHGALIRTAGKP